jgi:hypothetical protein
VGSPPPTKPEDIPKEDLLNLTMKVITKELNTYSIFFMRRTLLRGRGGLHLSPRMRSLRAVANISLHLHLEPFLLASHNR